ncbi:hypothetical protein G7062_10230 [Erysipelothrix sp. HDW6C]|uniref:InlB B-repeat-containing protein n=1 Tax=Erysipelothrix sp. HDW6C TaxID=2714930 RepID=UPI00140BCE4F|nr:InlB B-repeat-containing protein [Erysipelothrix sp. HDW6C]QIK70658.1 hypothetical protein G7062_10230 [Erysipelothrix sp. HDW6C]
MKSIKKTYKNWLAIALCAVLIFAGSPVFATIESDGSTDEVVEVDESKEALPVEDFEEDESVKEEISEDFEENNQLEQDLDDTFTEEEAVIESEVSDENTDAVSAIRRDKPKPEEFVLYPKVVVDSPRVNTKYGDKVVHTITGMDMALTPGDIIQTNSHYFYAFKTSAWQGKMQNSNFNFDSINIPSIKFWDEAGTQLNGRVFVRVLYRNLETGEDDDYAVTINLVDTSSFKYSIEDVNAKLEAEGISNFDIRAVGFSFGTDVVNDWSDPTIKETYAGQFYRSEYSEGIIFTYDYYQNENAPLQNGDYETVDYSFMFATKFGESTAEGYYRQEKTGWAFPLTSSSIAVAPESVEINKDFDYTLTIKNESNIANSFYLFIPKQTGLILNDRIDGDIMWEEHPHGYYGTIIAEDTNNYVLTPGSSITRTINIKLDDTFEGDAFNLDLMWKSGYAAGDQYEPITSTTDVTNIVRQASTVTFESNGGSIVDPITVDYNQLVDRPENPQREGYDFSGWFTDEEFRETWDFENDRVKEDVTLYAKWEVSTPIIEPSLSVERTVVSYNINTVVSEAQFLTDIGATATGNVRIASNFASVDFSKLGDYEVTIMLASRAAVTEIEVTVHIVSEGGQIPSDPVDPIRPLEPKEPINLVKPDVPNEQTPMLPATGVSDSSLAITIIIAGIAILFAQEIRKKYAKK